MAKITDDDVSDDIAMACVARELEMTFRRSQVWPLALAAASIFVIVLCLGPSLAAGIAATLWVALVVPIFSVSCMIYQSIVIAKILETPREFAISHMMVRYGMHLRYPSADNVDLWSVFPAIATTVGAAILLEWTGHALHVDWRPYGFWLAVAFCAAYLPLFHLVDRLLWSWHGRRELERHLGRDLSRLMAERGFQWHWWRGWQHPDATTATSA